MTIPTRRRVLSLLGISVIAGCSQTDFNQSDPPYQNRSKNRTDISPQATTITEITETAPPKETPQVGDRVLFRELPNKDAVLISKTVRKTKCKTRSVSHTNPASNNINIKFSYEDKESADENCDPSLDRIKFAVQVSFDILQSGISLKVNTFYWAKPVAYTTTATQTQSVKTIPKTMATHDNGAIQQ